MTDARFFFDISSGWAWLAAERIGTLIPEASWRPVYLPALLQLNGRQSWVLSSPDQVDQRLGELTERARRYGLAPPAWPAGYPLSLPAVSRPKEWLRVLRAATVAREHGRCEAFSLAAMRATHYDGRDLTDPDQLSVLASSVGLDGDAVMAATGDPAVKAALKDETEAAFAAGAPGVPTVVTGNAVYWGDDRLDDAARAAGGEPS